MSDIPDDLRYTKDHEWVRFEETGDPSTITAIVGITHYAQDALGDITFADLPDTSDDTVTSEGEVVLVVESVKAASDIYMPIDGKIVEANMKLEDEPELINSEPYDSGWMFKIEIDIEGDIDAFYNTLDGVLLDDKEYSNIVGL